MITLTRDEAQQVLHYMDDGGDYTDNYGKLIETLRARLAQPEPDIVQDAVVYGTGITKDGKRIDPASIYKEPEPHGYLWFTRHMEQRFTHRKPREDERIGDVKPVYIGPPQREWQGLTGEELQEIYQSAGTVHFKFAMVEAKLKEKNT